MEENIHLKDESNDRGYFTIIPNYILNHSTAIAQALYLQLKRLAGEKGEAYPASRYLCEKLGVSYNTLKKEFNYLLEKGWIENVGFRKIKTDGGLQKVKSYKIVDLWDLNNKHYQQQRGVKITTPCQRGVKIATQGVSTRGVKIEAKEDPLEEEPSFKKNIPSPEAKGGELKRKEIHFLKADMDFVTGKYSELKGVSPRGAEWLPIQQAVKTMFLSGRTKDDIVGCMEWLASKTEEWMENWTIRTAKIKMPEYIAQKGKHKTLREY